MSTFVPGRFAGRTAIVTGAGSGIGRATAVRLAQEGARVVATDVSEPRLKDLTAEHPDLDLVPVAGDISAEQTVQALVAAAGGRVDALANVAGVMDGFLPPAEVDDGTWHHVLEVNLTAVMRLTRAVLPGMLEAGSGAIVNVSSEAGLRGGAAGTAYTVSKHALNGYTRSVAFFHRADGIRCNAVAPGGTRTNIDGQFRSPHAAEVIGPILQTILPEPVEPEPVAAAIAYLLSDDAANITGAILPSDGGWSVI
jgi:NAD(P)-dependent dehydrogenase (short-subunit alcohol dehydrogenase family)